MLDRDENTSPDETGDDIHPLFHGAPKTTEFKKLRKRIIKETREAIERYAMVPASLPGAARPRWLVCLSGGKDSYTLLAALTELQWRGLLPVDTYWPATSTRGSPASRRRSCPTSCNAWGFPTASNTPTPIPGPFAICVG